MEHDIMDSRYLHILRHKDYSRRISDGTVLFSFEEFEVVPGGSFGLGLYSGSGP